MRHRKITRSPRIPGKKALSLKVQGKDMKYYWSCLVVFLLSSCVTKEDIHMRWYDDVAIRLLGCDFIVRNVGDNVYIVKWVCH